VKNYNTVLMGMGIAGGFMLAFASTGHAQVAGIAPDTARSVIRPYEEACEPALRMGDPVTACILDEARWLGDRGWPAYNERVLAIEVNWEGDRLHSAEVLLDRSDYDFALAFQRGENGTPLDEEPGQALFQAGSGAVGVYRDLMGDEFARALVLAPHVASRFAILVPVRAQ